MKRLEHPDGITPIRSDPPTVTDMFDRFLSAVEGLRDAFERDRQETQAQIAAIHERLDAMGGAGPRWLRVDEAVDYMGIGRTKLYDLIYTKQITRYGPAHMPRFRSDDLDAYLERASRNVS